MEVKLKGIHFENTKCVQLKVVIHTKKELDKNFQQALVKWVESSVKFLSSRLP